MYYGWRFCYQNINSHGIWNLLSVFTQPLETSSVQRKNKEVEKRFKKKIPVIFLTPVVTREKQILRNRARKSFHCDPAACLCGGCEFIYLLNKYSESFLLFELNGTMEIIYEGVTTKRPLPRDGHFSMRTVQTWRNSSLGPPYRLQASQNDRMLRGLTGLRRWVIEADCQCQMGKVGASHALRNEGAFIWLERRACMGMDGRSGNWWWEMRASF